MNQNTHDDIGSVLDMKNRKPSQVGKRGIYKLAGLSVY